MNLTSLVGFILPPFIDLINARIANSNLRYILSVLLCVAVGVLLNFNQLNFNDWQSLLGNIAVIFTSAQTTYRLYWAESRSRQMMIKKLT